MRIPKYCKHPNGQAYVYHKKIDRPGHRLYLGKHGSEESVQRYQEFIARLQSDDGSAVDSSGPLTVTGLILRYKEHAETYYADQAERDHIRAALKTLREHYGTDLAESLGPKKVKVLQRAWINHGYARSTCNRYTNLIKRFVRWCVSEELIPPAVSQAINTVEPLRKGKTDARETPDVVPVPFETVAATLPYLTNVVGSMVQVQYYCGMRPGEVCVMRPQDIKRDGEIWLCLPESHKNDWRNQALIKAIPDVAHPILEPFLDRKPHAYLFDPREAYQEHGRRLPVNRKRPIGDHYNRHSYRRAITYGIRKAARDGVEIESWSPNQLRHSIYTFVRQKLGADAAQHWCGHANLGTGDFYFERQTAELTRISNALKPFLKPETCE